MPDANANANGHTFYHVNDREAINILEKYTCFNFHDRRAVEAQLGNILFKGNSSIPVH